MPKTLPTDDKTFFLVCDDMRPEQGNKTTLLGVYGAPEVSFNAPADGAPVVLPSIVFYFCFTDGVGVFNGEMGFVDPTGKRQVAGAIGPLEKQPNGYMNVIFKMMPFAIQEGVFKPFVVLEGKIYERSIKFMVGQPEASKPK